MGAYDLSSIQDILIVIYYLIYRLICVIFIILDVYYDSLDAGNGVCMKQVKVKILREMR